MTASDTAPGSVTKVELYLCRTANCNPLTAGTLVGTDTSAPYQFTVSPNVTSGIARLQAKATDNQSGVGTSAILNLTIGRRSAATACADLERMTAKAADSGKPTADKASKAEKRKAKAKERRQEQKRKRLEHLCETATVKSRKADPTPTPTMTPEAEARSIGYRLS